MRTILPFSKFLNWPGFLVICLLIFNQSIAQVGLNNPNPHPSSLLDLKANDKGLLIPRMTTVDRARMTENGKKPAHALLVYDVTQDMYYFYDTIPNPDQWIALNPWQTNSKSGNITSAVSGNVGIGTIGQPTQKLDVNGNVKAKKFIGDGVIPKGGIIMWSGPLNEIPTGWTLCNGIDTLGMKVPNLTNMFIVGAGGGYSVGQQGGANEITLGIDQMPPHNHGGRTGGPRRAGTNEGVDFDHKHNYWDSFPSATEKVADENKENVYDDVISGTNRTTEGTIGGSGPAILNSHEHIINYEGGGRSFDNRPLYFALAYIIKLP